MKTLKYLRPFVLGCACAMLGLAKAQVTILSNNVNNPTEYVGCDGNSTEPLRVMHNANLPIEWYTDAIQRMMLNQTTSYTIGTFTNQNATGYLGLSPNGALWNADPGPFSRLHLHDGNGAYPLSYRPWMDNGVTFTTNLDQMYVGHKVESGVEAAAVIQWSDNDGGTFGPDVLKFIFTSDYISGNFGPNGLNGLELGRFHPQGWFGVGDWQSAGLQPDERVDVLDRTIRLRDFTHATLYRNNGFDRVLVADSTDGRVYWRDASTLGGGDCDWEVTGANNDVVTAWNPGASASCPDDESLVGIGTNAPFAKLHVERTTPNTATGIHVGVQAHVNVGTGGGAVGTLTSADGNQSTNNFGVYARGADATNDNYGVRAEADNAGNNNHGVWAEANNAGNISYGVHSEAGGSNGVDNFGVWSRAANAGNDNFGVRTEADNAGNNNHGVWAEVNNATNHNYGVVALASNAGDNNYGMVSQANNAATNNYGVVAQVSDAGNDNYGVVATASNSGNDSYGVWARASGADSISYGVHAEADGTNAVNSFGVWARATNGSNAATGVRAQASGGTNTNLGVLGHATGGSITRGGNFIGISGTAGNFGVEASASGGDQSTGVSATANGASVGNRAFSGGVFGTGPTNNYGVFVTVDGGRTNVGVHASAINGSANNFGVRALVSPAPQNWAGWFQGRVWITSNAWVQNGIPVISDERLKTGITDVSGALDKIMRLSPKVYHFDTTAFRHMSLSERPQIGLLAQQLEEVVPEAVEDAIYPAQYDSTGTMLHAAMPVKGVDYIKVVPLLIGAIKEQQGAIGERDSTIAGLRTRLDAQEERLRRLEQRLDACCTNPDGDGMRRAPVEGPQDAPRLGNDMLRVQPNPFNERATLLYDLPRGGRVQLMANSADGKQLRVLEEAVREQGSYQYEWNTAGLSAGVYYVTLLVDGEPLVKRVVKVQ